MSYFIVQTIEDNELFVKDKIDLSIEGASTIIPVYSEMQDVDGKNLIVFTRPLEEYVVVEAEQSVFKENLKKILRIGGVVSVPGGDKPTDNEEVLPFIHQIDKSTLKALKTGFVNIIGGQYAGRRGKVVSFKLPLVKLNIISATDAKKKIPACVAIWDVVKVLEEK